MADVTIYTKPGCPYCAKALQHYRGNKIDFDEVSVKDNFDVQQKVTTLTGGKRIVPVIVDKSEVTVGWNGGG